MRSRTIPVLVATLSASSHGFQGPLPRQACRRRRIDATATKTFPALPALNGPATAVPALRATVEVNDETKRNANDLHPSAATPPAEAESTSERGGPNGVPIADKIGALVELEQEQDKYFFAMAFLPPIVAFAAWKDVSLALSSFLDMYGVARRDIDGVFANNLLRPTITGVVVPVIAIALATLVSTTINVLRDREVRLRTLINKESCDLYLLRQAVFGLFGTRQHARRRARALALLGSYIEQLEGESSLGAIDALQELQLSGGIAANELNQLTRMLHGIDGAAASRQGSVGYADDLVRSLNDYRSERVAELLSGFPAIHWFVLISLGVSVCFSFLLASNQPMNEYLNSITLRALFALLVGTCSGTATLCINLADPFRGTFSILDASAQLGELRLCLEKDVADATAEAGEISSNFVHALLLGESKESYDATGGSVQTSVQLNGDESDATSQPSGDGNERGVASETKKRYGLIPTLYFHLLTGPFGSSMKALGEVLAWLARIISVTFGRRSWRWRRRRNEAPNSP